MNLIICTLLALSISSHACDTVGFRNHNMGNIASKKLLWSATGRDKYGYLKFPTDRKGLKAIRLNLKAYWTKHHINTLTGIVYRWTEVHGIYTLKEQNDYFEKMINYTSFIPKQKLDMNDPYVLETLARGIVMAENGCDGIPDGMYKSVFHTGGK